MPPPGTLLDSLLLAKIACTNGVDCKAIYASASSAQFQLYGCSAMDDANGFCQGCDTSRDGTTHLRVYPTSSGGAPRSCADLVPAAMARGYGSLPGKSRSAPGVGATTLYSGTYAIALESGTAAMHCDFETDGGGWTLASIVMSHSHDDCNKYPLDGENVAEMIDPAYEDWASLSRNDFDALFNAHPDTVVKIVSTQAFDGTYYIQREPSSSGAFSAFHAIRYVPEWGSAGTDYSFAHLALDYDPGSNVVTHSGRTMKHWENNQARCNGQTFVVSRHGIVGDTNHGCQWLFTFESRCGSRTASYCHGQPVEILQSTFFFSDQRNCIAHEHSYGPDPYSC